jgi:hypothetical protein
MWIYATTLANLENVLRSHKPVIEESLLYDFINMKCPSYKQAVSDTKRFVVTLHWR